MKNSIFKIKKIIENIANVVKLMILIQCRKILQYTYSNGIQIFIIDTLSVSMFLAILLCFYSISRKI